MNQADGHGCPEQSRITSRRAARGRSRFPQQRAPGSRGSRPSSPAPGRAWDGLSHYALWQRLVETRTRYAIILEDNARLEDGFRAVIHDLMKMAGEWDIVMLSPKRVYAVDREVAALATDRRLVRFARRVAGAVGYLIRLEAAENLVHYCWRIRAPIDWLYAEWWKNGLRVYAVIPAIITHAGLPSTIQVRSRVKRSALEYAAGAAHRWADRLHLRAARLYDCFAYQEGSYEHHSSAAGMTSSSTSSLTIRQSLMSALLRMSFPQGRCRRLPR